MGGILYLRITEHGTRRTVHGKPRTSRAGHRACHQRSAFSVQCSGCKFRGSKVQGSRFWVYPPAAWFWVLNPFNLRNLWTISHRCAFPVVGRATVPAAIRRVGHAQRRHSRSAGACAACRADRLRRADHCSDRRQAATMGCPTLCPLPFSLCSLRHLILCHAPCALRRAPLFASQRFQRLE